MKRVRQRLVRSDQGRPLRNHRNLSKAGAHAEAAKMFEDVGLSPASQFRDKLPRQIAGDQRRLVGAPDMNGSNVAAANVA